MPKRAPSRTTTGVAASSVCDLVSSEWICACGHRNWFHPGTTKSPLNRLFCQSCRSPADHRAEIVSKVVQKLHAQMQVRKVTADQAAQTIYGWVCCRCGFSRRVDPKPPRMAWSGLRKEGGVLVLRFSGDKIVCDCAYSHPCCECCLRFTLTTARGSREEHPTTPERTRAVTIRLVNDKAGPELKRKPLPGDTSETVSQTFYTTTHHPYEAHLTSKYEDEIPIILQDDAERPESQTRYSSITEFPGPQSGSSHLPVLYKQEPASPQRQEYSRKYKPSSDARVVVAYREKLEEKCRLRAMPSPDTLFPGSERANRYPQTSYNRYEPSKGGTSLEKNRPELGYSAEYEEYSRLNPFVSSDSADETLEPRAHASSSTALFPSAEGDNPYLPASYNGNPARKVKEAAEYEPRKSEERDGYYYSHVNPAGEEGNNKKPSPQARIRRVVTNAGNAPNVSKPLPPLPLPRRSSRLDSKLEPD